MRHSSLSDHRVPLAAAKAVLAVLAALVVVKVVLVEVDLAAVAETTNRDLENL